MFDLEAARKAGYGDDVIARALAQEQGVDFDAALKAGYSPTDMLPSLMDGSKGKGFIEQAGDFISDTFSGEPSVADQAEAYSAKSQERAAPGNLAPLSEAGYNKIASGAVESPQDGGIISRAATAAGADEGKQAELRAVDDTFMRAEAEKKTEQDQYGEFKRENPNIAAFASGTNSLAGSFADIPQLSNDLIKQVAIDPFRHLFGKESLPPTARFQIAKDFEQAGKDYMPGIAKKSLSELNGYKEVGSWIAAQASMQSPQIVASTGAALIPKLRAAYLSLMGLSSGASNYQENLEKGVNQNTAMKGALTNAAFEVIGESLPFGVFDSVGKYIKNLPLPQRGALIADALKKTLLVVGAGVAQQASEGIGEGVTQIGQNASERYVIGDKSVGLMDRVPEAVAIGAIMGTPTAIAQSYRAAKTPADILDKSKTVSESIEIAASIVDEPSGIINAAPSNPITEEVQNGQSINPSAGAVDTGSAAGTGDNDTGIDAAELLGNDDGAPDGQGSLGSGDTGDILGAAGQNQPISDGRDAAVTFNDPHEERLNRHFSKARDSNIPLEHAQALVPEQDMDHVTGYFRGEDKAPTVERAQKFVEDTGAKAHYVEADVANLGGINAHFKNSAVQANKVYRAIADIFKAEMEKAGQRAVMIRQGGDEVNAVVIGGTDESIKAAMAATQKSIKEYTDANGLSDIYNPKGGLPGTGLHLGFSSILPGEHINDIFDAASKDLDASKQKKGQENVTGIKSREAGVVAPVGQAGGIREGAGTEGTGNRGAQDATQSGIPAQESPRTSEVTATRADTIGIREHVETLTKRRNVISQIQGISAKEYSVAIEKAKIALKTGKGNASYFTKLAKRFAGKDAEVHAALTSIANLLEGPAVKKVQKPSTDLIQRIKQLGGINKDYAEDFGAKDAKFNIKSAFKQGGESPDFIARQLKDEGYPLSEDDLIGGLSEFVQRYIKGERSFKHVDAEASAMSEADDRAFMEMVPDAEKHGINWREFKSPDDLYIAITKAEDALNDAEEAALDIVLGDTDITLDDVQQSTSAEVDAWLSGENDNARGHTESTAGIAASESTQGSASSTQDTGGAQETGFELQSQTNAQVAKQEAAAAKAKAEAEKEPPSENVSADQSDMFNTQDSLFNSNRAEPVADKHALIQQDFAENRKALESLKIGDEVEWISPGTYTNDDGSKREGHYIKGTISKIADKDQGRIVVGTYTIGASHVSKVKNQPLPSEADTKAKKIEVLKEQAKGKITGDQGAALKELADAGEHAAVDAVLKPHERAIWIPNMKPAKLQKLLSKETLSSDDIEDLKDFKYFLINQKQDAYEKGFYSILETSGQNDIAYVLKDKFLLVNIDNKLDEVLKPDTPSAKDQWDAMTPAQRFNMLDKFAGTGQTDMGERYKNRTWESFNTGEKSTLSAVMDTPGKLPTANDAALNSEEPQADAIDERISAAEASGIILSDADKDAVRASLERADELRGKANRIMGRSRDPMNKGDAFPMGVGFTKITKRTSQRIDASVKAAGEAVSVFNKASAAEKYAEALLTGKGTEADKIRKEAKREEAQRALINKLVNHKKGDKIGPFTIERVNSDRDGYPATYTISGDGIIKGVQDKVDVVRDFFGGDKLAFRAVVDDVRSSQENVNNSEQPASDDAAPEAGTRAGHDALFERIRKGEASADEFKAAFEALANNKESVLSELDAMTKAEIFNEYPSLEYRYKNEKKADVVKAAYRDMQDDYTLGESYSYGMSSGSRDSSIKAIVDRATDETLAKYAEDIKAAKAERAAANAEALAGMENPETLEDYQRIMGAKAKEIGDKATFNEVRMSLPLEQRIKYDELAAEYNRGERAKRKTAQQEQSLRAPGEAVETTEIIKTKHTKHGHDLWQFQMVQRVAPDEFKSLATQAKRLGGDYSSYRGNGAIPGWQFRSEEAAKAFKALIAGDTAHAKDVMQTRRDAYADDRSQTAVERLTEMADKLEERADESLGQDRKQNTARRAGFAASAERAANADKAMAQTMRNIANGIEDGTAKMLDKVRQKVQVETLQGFVHTAFSELQREKYPSYAEQEKHSGERPTVEAADYAKFPTYTVFRSDLANLGRELLETDGTKRLGQQIMKVADDVSASYLKFAKDNLTKVTGFRNKDGALAAFASKSIAEQAISRSGFKGSAIVLPIKRNENLIILSPSEAIKRGIWEGDNDKRITLSPEVGAEIVEKLGVKRRDDIGRRNNAPWQFMNAYESRKRLAGMNIETPAELRTALREFIELREAPKEADKIKQMERAMIGRKNDGFDFFPTPATAADDAIATLDIKEGMSVYEPQAGMGHIADRIREAGFEPDVGEIASDRRELLEAKGYNIVSRDFMTMRLEDTPNGEGYDRIIMNPPFSDRRDALHVEHAYGLLKPGGRLVSIMGEGVFYGQDKKADNFRDWLEQVGGTDEKLEEGTFLDPSLPVNTGANARMVVINKDDSNVPSYSRAQSTTDTYNNRIDQLFSGEPASRDGVVALDRSDMLDMLGYGAMPVHVAEGKVIAGQYNHGLTAEHWKKIPEWLSNPAAVFDSDTVKGRLVFIAPELLDGIPIRMIVEPNSDVGGMDVHLLVNAYDAKGKIPTARWVSERLTRYIDKAKSRQFLATSGLQLPRVLQSVIGSSHKIYTDADLVKYRALNKSVEFSRSVDNTSTEVSEYEATRGINQLQTAVRKDLGNDEITISQSVPLDQLARAGGTRSTGEARSFELAQAIAAHFGQKVVTFENRTPEIFDFNGVSFDGKIFLNAKANRPAHVIFGHEFLHELKKGNQPAYDKLMSILEPMMKNVEGFREAANIEAKMSVDDVKEELAANLVGNRFAEQSFWRMLMLRAPKHFKAIVELAVKLLSDIHLNITGNAKLAGDEFITDMDKAREAISEAVASYRKMTGDKTYEPKYMTAWHGSPHDHDRFDMSKIGTGEGAQAYGHGLYFASNRDIAEYYRRALSENAIIVYNDPQHDGKHVIMDGNTVISKHSTSESAQRALKKYQASKGNGRIYQVELAPNEDEYLLWDKPLSEQSDKVRTALEKAGIVESRGKAEDDYASRYAQAVKKEGGNASAVKQAILNLVRNREMSDKDWNILLRENPQPEGFDLNDIHDEYRPSYWKSALNRVTAELETYSAGKVGATIYGDIEVALGQNTESAAALRDIIGIPEDEAYQARADELASKVLHSIGIRGIKYLDGSSRGKGDGDFNYVIFDDKDVSITAKYSRAQQDKIPLQGGETGSQTDWDAPGETLLDDVIYKLQNKNIDLKRVIEAVKATGTELADKYNAYLQEELFHGRAAKRTQDFVNTEMKPLLDDMRMRGLTIEQLDEYLHARHAKEANALIAERDPDMPDGGSGMTDQQADDYMEGLSDSQKTRLDAVAKRVDAILAKTRELYTSYGLVSKNETDAWGTMFEHYVPLMREDHDGGMGVGQGFSVKGKEVKHRTGSTAKVVDILANIALQREKAITRGEKNRVAVSLAGLVKLNPNPDFWTFGKVPTERVLNEKTGLVEERIDPMFKSRPNAIIAKISDGKGNVVERAVIFNESNDRAMRMAESMKNLDAPQLGGLMGVSAQVTRYFASVNTQYNPVFGITNIVRDVQGMALNLDNTALAKHKLDVIKAIPAMLKGIYQDARMERKGHANDSETSQLWEEMQDEGGMTGYRDLYRNSEDRANAIKHELDPHNWANNKWGKVFTAGGLLKMPLTKAQDIAGPIFDWLSDYNQTLEGATRLATYKVARDNGFTKQQAASLSKNITVNFNRKGQWGQHAGALYAFFNAAMQGTARIGQTIFTMDKGDIKTLRLNKTGKTIVYGGVLLGAMQAVALAAAGFGDDEPPEFVRERSLIFPIGNKKYVSIPMPLGYHVLPNIGRIAMEFTMNGFKKPTDHVIKLAGIFAEAFNPMGSAGFSMQTIVPTPFDPLAALDSNKDWTGKPIAKPRFDTVTPGFSHNKDTATTLSKLIAEAINTLTGGDEYTAGKISPTADQLDYLAGQVGGGVWREGSKAEQAVMAMFTGEELPTHKIPLVGRFYGDGESKAGQGGAYYSNLQRIKEIEAGLEGRLEDRLPVDKFKRDNPEYRLIGRAKLAESTLRSLQKRKREMIEHDVPREKIKLVEERITQVMKQFNESVSKFETTAP